MKFYQEVTLLPGAEIAEAFLMSKVFIQLHLAIVQSQKENPDAVYGIAFPEYHAKGLGRKIRVFSTSTDSLEVLRISSFLERLCDYVHIIRPRIVPESRIRGYAIYKRYRQQGSVELTARRYAKRHCVSYEEALDRYKDMENKNSNLPYVILNSLSTKQKFSLFIAMQDSKQTSEIEFDKYGLSHKTALPIF